jgi:hypothetical protein
MGCPFANISYVGVVEEAVRFVENRGSTGHFYCLAVDAQGGDFPENEATLWLGARLQEAGRNR